MGTKMTDEEIMLNPLCDITPVALYDMSIENVVERAAKKQIFRTAKDAANFLGYELNKFGERIGVGRYATHRGTGKVYAARKISKVNA